MNIKNIGYLAEFYYINSFYSVHIYAKMYNPVSTVLVLLENGEFPKVLPAKMKSVTSAI